MERRFEEILNMTDEQAFHIVNHFIMHVVPGARGSGKSLTILRYQVALLHAMAALEEKMEVNHILYECKYGKEGDMCRHTSRIADAKNFDHELVNSINYYTERIDNNDKQT